MSVLYRRLAWLNEAPEWISEKYAGMTGGDKDPQKGEKIYGIFNGGCESADLEAAGYVGSRDCFNCAGDPKRV